jgi:hypothetical protein
LIRSMRSPSRLEFLSIEDGASPFEQLVFLLVM